MAIKVKDLTGTTINHWFVMGEYIHRRAPNGSNVRYEKCRCLLCGKEKYVARGHLLKGSSKCCGCENEDRRQYKIGEQYGYWTVVGERKKNYVKCRCICGLIKDVNIWHMIRGATKSCGCVNRLSLTTKQTNIIKKDLYWVLYSNKHLFSKTAFYNKYSHAKTRCENKNCERYKNYGGRGIKFKWKNFEEFYHDMYSSYKEHVREFGEKNTTLDRIDVNGNYCKENCRRATWYEQMNNTQKSKKIEYNGVVYDSISDLCHKLNRDKDRSMIDSRLRHGWTIEDAILIPKKINVKKI